MSAPTATLLPLYGLTTRIALAVGVLALFVVVNLILQAVLARALRNRSVHPGLVVLVPNQTIFTSAVVVTPPAPPTAARDAAPT